MNTLLLDATTWDLTVNRFGNIAVATDPYAAAQDVASEVRLFRGELWYDTTRGLPYFKATALDNQNILGQVPSRGYLMAVISEAALSVPGVQSVSVELDPITARRELSGRIHLTMESGQTITQSIGVTPWYVNAVTPTTRRTPPPDPDPVPFLLDDQGNIILDDEGNAISL